MQDSIDRAEMVPWLLLGCCMFVIIYQFTKRKKFPPGPRPWPFFGNSSIVKNYSIKYRGLHNGLIELCKDYNTDILGLKLGGENVIVVQSEKTIDQVLTRDEFQGRPDNFFIRLRSMGTRKGITMTDGPLWQEQRSFALKHMHNLGLGKSRMEYLIHEEIAELFKELQENGSNVRIQQFISKSVLNVLWAMVTGARFKNNESIDKLVNLMGKRAKAFDMAGGILNQFPWARFIAPEKTGYNLIKQLNNDFKNLIQETIQEHKFTYKENVTRDFIDAFLHEMNKNEPTSTFTEDQLIMVCMDFFIAGSQTTSSTIDFALLHMILNPNIQTKVQEEVDRVLAGKFASLHDKQRLPYVEAVLLESQRLSTVVPVIGPRRVLKETDLGGYTIPKNATVLLNLVPNSKDEQKWEKGDIFIPERFLDENGLITDKYSYSFGKGKRRCPGEPLAKGFIFVFFASFLHNFKLEFIDKMNPPITGFIPGITLSPLPYDMKLIKRNLQR